jgi:DNA-binding beta-propeller fold protein YncE
MRRDGNVFSLSSRTFLPPIVIPTLNGVLQLGGMALSPDGSHLLVTNWADGSVVIVNPDDLSTQVVAVTAPANSNPWLQGPQAVAVGNNGKALISVAGAPSGSPSIRQRSKTKKSSRSIAGGSAPFANLWELDLGSLTVTPLVFASGGTASPLSVKSTDDGSKICLAGEYQPLALYDSATDTFQSGPGQGGSGDCAVGGVTAVAGPTSSADGGNSFYRFRQCLGLSSERKAERSLAPADHVSAN